MAWQAAPTPASQDWSILRHQMKQKYNYMAVIFSTIYEG